MAEQIKTNHPNHIEPSAQSSEAPAEHRHEDTSHGQNDEKQSQAVQDDTTETAQKTLPVDDQKNLLIDPETKFVSIVDEILKEETNGDPSNSTIEENSSLTALTVFSEATVNSDSLLTDSNNIPLQNGMSFASRLQSDSPDQVTSVGSMMKNDIFSFNKSFESTEIPHSRDYNPSPVIITRKYTTEELQSHIETPTAPPAYHRPPMPDIAYNIKSGLYTDNDLSKLATAENWLGRSVDGAAIKTSDTNWTDYASSVSYLADLYKDASQTIYWSIPLIPQTGATLEDAAISGTYLIQWTNIANDLANNHTAGEPIYIKTGWDFNLPGLAWSATGKESTYIAAYQNFVDAFRSVSSDFVFEWTPHIDSLGANPALAYPGDAYVDIIGMDFYWDPIFDQQATAISAWTYTLNQNYGLQWLENFAAAHGKQTAYSGWGVNSDNAAYYIQQAANWFTKHDVAYQIYSDSNSTYQGQMSNDQYPHAAAIFKLIFGSDSMIVGTSGTDYLVGDDHNNYLDGVTGQGETLIGYDGDDVYSVHPFSLQGGSTKIIEQPNEGNDTVLNWAASYTMAANVENIINLAVGNQTAIGNDLDNIMSDGVLSYGTLGSGYFHHDTFNGKGGADTMYGGGGADTFIFDDVDFSGIDTVKDFKISDGDKLVFSALLDTFDPLQDVITDFLNITQNGANSVVSVDRDGTGTAYGWQTVVILENTTGLTDEAALHTAGNIVI